MLLALRTRMERGVASGAYTPCKARLRTRHERGFLNGYSVCIGSPHAGKKERAVRPRFPSARPSPTRVMRAPL